MAKRLSLTLLAAAAVLAAPAAALADDDFIGFYRGIDVNTGSLDALSITQNDTGGYVIVLHATAFGLCTGANTSAVARAAGEVREGDLTRTDGTVSCADGTTHPLRDGRFSLTNDEELLTLRVPDQADVTYHRVSD